MVANESIQRPSVPQKPTSDNTETETLLEKSSSAAAITQLSGSRKEIGALK